VESGTGHLDRERAERVYKTEGIVLRHGDMGEADRLITLFTPYRGKLRAVAKGARRPTSKLAGHLEQFTHTNVLIARGRSLDLITQAQSLHSFIAIRENLRLVLYASYAVELVDRSTEWDSENRQLFNLLYAMLVHLEITQHPDTALRAFELAALDILGYKPRLDKCVVCNRPLDSVINGFSAAAGGVLCPLCRARETDARDITPASLAMLRRLQDGGLAAAASLHMSPDTRLEIESVLAEYLHYRLEFDLNSAHVLRSLRRQIALFNP
jgi:DNA repair protein RecO (recombination protein O)